MKSLSLSVAAVAALGLSVAPAGAARPPRDLVATLSGAREVPVVSTAAKGSFRAEIADDGLSFEYFLDYEGFEGNVTQAHIHIAQRFASGGISVWLCKTGLVTVPPTVPADTPVCGAPGGDGPEATGVISAEDVVGPATQGVPAMQFAELLALIRAGNAYVNVHSSVAPGGEVRGQINRARGASDPANHDDHHHDH